MKQPRTRAIAALVLIGVAIVATVAEAPSDESGSSGGGPETTAPSSSQQSPLPLGTTVEVAEGWNLTVNSSEPDANARLAAGNMFNEPAAGTQYVAVNVTVTNNSDQPSAPFVQMKLSLVPASGVGIDPSLFVAGVSGQLDTTAQMQPGASATGDVFFEVPPVDILTAVMLGQSVFTLDAAKDQKFLAIR